jgi:hypothetical protein
MSSKCVCQKLCSFVILQLISPSDFTAVTLPNKQSAIIQVAAGGNVSACVDSDGYLVYWGGISEHHELSVRQPSVIQVREECLRDGVDGMFGLMFRLFRA